MARAKRRKTAAEIAAALIARRGQDFEAIGLAPEAAALQTQSDIEITRKGDTRVSHKTGAKVEENSARRLDAFEALRDGMEKGCYDAARRFERDLAISLNEHDRGRSLMRVDNEKPGDRMDDIVAASKRLGEVMRFVSYRDAWLLQWLIRPPANRFEGWRAIVYHITGETDRLCQGAAVRLACGALRDAYERVDAEKPATKRHAVAA